MASRARPKAPAKAKLLVTPHVENQTEVLFIEVSGRLWVTCRR